MILNAILLYMYEAVQFGMWSHLSAKRKLIFWIYSTEGKLKTDTK